MKSLSLGAIDGEEEETSSTAKTKPLFERILRCSTRYFAFQRQTLLSVGVLFILMMIFVRLGKAPPGVCVFDIEGIYALYFYFVEFDTFGLITILFLILHL